MYEVMFDYLYMTQVDPRARLVGQKMNPSRTYTPRVRPLDNSEVELYLTFDSIRVR